MVNGEGAQSQCSNTFLFFVFNNHKLSQYPEVKRIINFRIWCRETGETLSVLTNHNEMVTAVHLVTRCHLLSMGLDNKIYRYKITYPDISEDFDSKISCTHLSQNTRFVCLIFDSLNIASTIHDLFKQELLMWSVTADMFSSRNMYGA